MIPDWILTLFANFPAVLVTIAVIGAAAIIWLVLK